MNHFKEEEKLCIHLINVNYIFLLTQKLLQIFTIFYLFFFYLYVILKKIDLNQNFKEQKKNFKINVHYLKNRKYLFIFKFSL